MPKGRTRSTSAEAAEIRRLLAETRRAPRSDQKHLRDKLRRIGFFITDFDQSFKVFGSEDFDRLVAQVLVVIDSNHE